MNSIEKLTKLQATLSDQYVPGQLSTVALLGLFGEAGEVLEEVNFDVPDQDDPSVLDYLMPSLSVGSLDLVIKSSKLAEHMKKKVRSGQLKMDADVSIGRGTYFIAELADCAYYLNILATNVGVTLEDLCEIAHNKILAKQAGTGSSEQQK